MRILVAGLLVAVVFAGCISSSDDGNDGMSEHDHTTNPVPTVDAQATFDELDHFANTYGERADNLPAHTGARDYMAQVFQEAGLEVWRQKFTNGIDQENIIGIKWGEETDKFVVIGGHYDMVTTECAVQCVIRPFSQGAYDDGSGISMTLNLARAFADVPTKYSLMFTAFDGEERGLQGSGALANAFIDGLVPNNGTAVAMLNLDMIGLNWPGVDAPIYFDTNSNDLQAFTDNARKNISMPDEAIQYQGISLGRSDYAHFFAMGIPTGFFISDFEEWQLPADVPVTLPPLPQSAYPFWHIEDTMTTMVLMAGSEADVVAGFQSILDISAEVIYKLGNDAEMMDAVVA